MFVFLSGIIMFYVLQTIMLFLKESNIKIKRLFFYLFVIFETGLPLYFTILDFMLRQSNKKTWIRYINLYWIVLCKQPECDKGELPLQCGRRCRRIQDNRNRKLDKGKYKEYWL